MPSPCRPVRAALEINSVYIWYRSPPQTNWIIALSAYSVPSRTDSLAAAGSTPRPIAWTGGHREPGHPGFAEHVDDPVEHFRSDHRIDFDQCSHDSPPYSAVPRAIES